RELDRVQDLRVAGAPAEVAGERLANLVARRRGVLREQRLRGEQDARRAVPALRGAELRERLLQRVEPPSGCHALHRLDGAALEIGGKRETREDRGAVDDHRAGTALAELAA